MLQTGRIAAVGAVVALLGAAPAVAQRYDEGARYRDHGPVLYGLAGGFSALADLTQQGASFKTGYDVGGGVGYQFNRNVALRANLNFSRAQATASPLSPVDGQNFNRYFYDLDLQVRYPTSIGLAPYAVLGGGAVTIDPRSTSRSSFTRLTGKVGAGLGYHFANTGASLFAEWDGWFYDWNRDLVSLEPTDITRTQFDTAWTGGLRFGF